MKYIELTRQEVSDFIMNDPKLIYMGVTDEEMAYMHENKEYLLSSRSNYVGIEDDKENLVCVLKWELFTVDVVSVHFYVASRYHGIGLSMEIWDFVSNHMKENTTVRKVIVFVPEACEHVVRCTERNGFKREGEITNACTWRKEIKSIYIYGIDIVRETK